MAGKILGIDCGNQLLKIAVCKGKRLVKYVTETMPDNIVQDGRIVSFHALSDFLKETIRQNHINGKNVVMVMPADTYYLRRTRLPKMNIQQLSVNLPFEFHDYVTGDKDDYVYDYAVLSMEENEMELLAAATSKTMIVEYKEMLARAGLKLAGLVPDVVGIQNIVLPHPTGTRLPEKDFAILDIGHGGTRLYFYSHGAYEITRTMDFGARDLAAQAAELLGVDIHIAQLYIENDQDGILERPEIADSITGMATEIMRVMNFYSYNNPESDIEQIYYFGGGMNPDRLVQEVVDMTGLPVHPLTDFMSDTQDVSGLILGPQAYGIILN